MAARLLYLLLFALAGMVAVPAGHAEGAVKCPGSYDQRTWTNCVGTYTTASRNTYAGEFINGFPQGKGTYTSAKGDRYVGEFENSKFHGRGTFNWTRWSSGRKSVGGVFRELKKFGQGGKYVGNWRSGKFYGVGTITYADGNVLEGRWKNGLLVAAKQAQPPAAKKRTPHPPKSSSSGSGFFVSNLGHVVTNQHVVKRCRKVTVGDNALKQIAASVIETDQRNDLALLRISNLELASAKTKKLVAKLGLTVTPLASRGLLRRDSVELGEDVIVAGFPFGDIFSNIIKITKGVVSAKRGYGDDSGQFQLDAAVQPGNSGGPIYDENGNIIGVVVSQLNKMKFAKTTGSIPENVNFGIKASTVREFLNSSGLPTKWSNRAKRMSSKDIAKIAENQTVMVVCHR